MVAKGDYAVPREVRALRPKGVDCIVKRISGHYYVYERRRVEDPARPGRTKWVSGGVIGKIEGGRYVPNAPREDATRGDPEVKDYGAYALLLALTGWVHMLLSEALGWERGTQVYAQALCWEAEGYVPACRMSDVYGGSVLSNAWPTLPVGESAVGEELEWLGRNRVTCCKAEQALIDGGSGTYAIDGHVILSTSRENELAAYGAKYRKVGGEQVNIMGIHDVDRDRPVSAMAYDGALPDKVTVKEVFEWYRLDGCRILADMGFYSEDVLDILRQRGRTFVIPCPPNTVVRKAALLDLSYTGEFAYERNERGRKAEVRVSFLESTVSELEDAWQKHLDEEARKSGKKRAGRVRRSAFPDDRVIVLRDEAMHDRLVADYRAQIGRVKGRTEERLRELEPAFGVIVLRTNGAGVPKDVYLDYKKRWRIETHYDHVANGMEFGGLREQDWYVEQGATFVMMAAGLVHSELVRALRGAKVPAVAGMSVPDCLAKAKRLKAVRHEDGSWHVSCAPKAVTQMMSALGVDVTGDLERLRTDTFGA